MMAFRHIVNLSNSIIGVSLLSMPYCFKTSGILLSILSIIISSFINRFACHLILRSARISKRRNFENLAFGVYGITGKLIAEIAILGFLSGSCVAFFVVIGDLCPSLITQLFDIPNYSHLRTFTMMFIGMFIALPLCLKRKVDASFSTISMFLYFLLAMNLFTEALSRFTFEDDKLFNKLNYWNFEHYFQVLPIFITCLSCQPQLFEIFDHSTIFSEDKNAMARINATIKKSIFVCSTMYIVVGLFGYLAFFETIEGNLLVDLPHNLLTVLTKFGFLVTVVCSLPLCLFPCRTSLHSLIYGKATSSLLNEMTLTDSYIPDDRWLFLTVLLIVITICISILLPHIEFILAILGSTTGAVVCLVLPSLFFISLTFKNTSERFFAYFILYFGFALLLICSFTLINVDQQELSSQGQMVKNLNLSANRIEKLIEQNEKVDQFKKPIIVNNDAVIKKDEQKDKLIENELKNKELRSKELKSKVLNENELNDSNLNVLTDNELKNKDELKINELKNNNKLSKQLNKEKSGFISAVEMNKKSLSKENDKLKENNKLNLKEDLNNSINKPIDKTMDKAVDKNSDKLIVKPIFKPNQTKSNETVIKNVAKSVNDKKVPDIVMKNKKDDKNLEVNKIDKDFKK